MNLTMFFYARITLFVFLLFSLVDTRISPNSQSPLPYEPLVDKDYGISLELFADLEELSRIVDIAYCVGVTGTGIQKPFLCESRCQDFTSFELVKVGLG